LRSLSAKLGAAMRRPGAAGLENDAMDLAAAEGLVVRPGPREQVDPKVLADLRRAILAPHKVRLDDYRYRSTGNTGHVTVRPYGFLHGTRSYLVAHSENEWARDVRCFALANIRAVTVLEDTTFPKPRGWSLEGFARQSFGAWVEKPANVEWRFSPAVADEAGRWLFHPTQKTRRTRDGSLVVRFRAGGLREMAWHLVTWGADVEVVKPPRLRDEIARLGSVAARLSGNRSQSARDTRARRALAGPDRPAD
jgi:predicted DNA-binding transcriptional regulator YafY